tara:strand:+ start:11139 stop:11996 length:858 start_codon:yes stop_codon:yes gene_type:complete
MSSLLNIFLTFFGKLPNKIIYFLSDILSFIAYKLLKYRLEIVRVNLKKSFPNLGPKTLKSIEVAFYKNFCDVLVENLLLHSISKPELQNKMKLINPKVFKDLNFKSKGVLLVGAHYNNWEWMALSLSTYLNNRLYTVYKPLSNLSVDKIMKDSRKRFGANIIPMDSFAKTVIKNKNQASVNLMLVDQSPHKSKLDFFCNFLNQDTPVYLGPEKLIKSTELELYFIEVHRVKRGNYEMKVVPLLHNTLSKFGDITELHVKHLENLIQMRPQNWLWTHRRWKHSRKK